MYSRCNGQRPHRGTNHKEKVYVLCFFWLSGTRPPLVRRVLTVSAPPPHREQLQPPTRWYAETKTGRDRQEESNRNGIERIWHLMGWSEFGVEGWRIISARSSTDWRLSEYSLGSLAVELRLALCDLFFNPACGELNHYTHIVARKESHPRTVLGCLYWKMPVWSRWFM